MKLICGALRTTCAYTLLLCFVAVPAISQDISRFVFDDLVPVPPQEDPDIVLPRDYLPVDAENGDAEAQYNLAVTLRREDAATASKWFLRAAEQGHSWAQYGLGLQYLYGQGVAKDNENALEWFRKAANQGHMWAQHDLGWMYANGVGVPINDLEAVKWYKSAADQGHIWAQGSLAKLYFSGKGVEQNLVTAYTWANVAQTDEGGARVAAGEMLNKIAKEMSPSEIAEAQKASTAIHQKIRANQEKRPRSELDYRGYEIMPRISEFALPDWWMNADPPELPSSAIKLHRNEKYGFAVGIPWRWWRIPDEETQELYNQSYSTAGKSVGTWVAAYQRGDRQSFTPPYMVIGFIPYKAGFNPGNFDIEKLFNEMSGGVFEKCLKKNIERMSSDKVKEILSALQYDDPIFDVSNGSMTARVKVAVDGAGDYEVFSCSFFGKHHMVQIAFTTEVGQFENIVGDVELMNSSFRFDELNALPKSSAERSAWSERLNRWSAELIVYGSISALGVVIPVVVGIWLKATRRSQERED